MGNIVRMVVKGKQRKGFVDSPYWFDSLVLLENLPGAVHRQSSDVEAQLSTSRSRHSIDEDGSEKAIEEVAGSGEKAARL
jgi:hypothetical protein